MGLYKDPDGKSITTFKPNSEKDSATVDKSTSESEMKDLRRKVVELETSLKQYVRCTTLWKTFKCVGSLQTSSGTIPTKNLSFSLNVYCA